MDRVPAIVFGGLLVLTGLGMLLYQRRARLQLAHAPAEAEEMRFLRRRGSRRTQVAGMILLIGIMIPVGDSLIPWKNAPLTFGVYWMIVIGLALWTGLLAVGDLVATRSHMAMEINRLHRKKLELRHLARRAEELKRDQSRE